MFSLTPGMPGRSVQAPRTIRSIDTPAWEARYSARITAGSLRAFILAMMRPGRPSRACVASRLIRRSSPRCRVKGDCIICWSRGGGDRPDSCWKICCTSPATCGCAVISPMSVYARAVPAW